MAEISPDDFVFVGAFTPNEVKRITDHLEKLEVDYQVEFDDSETHRLSPGSVLNGSWEATATVKLYVDPQKLLEFEAVFETLYPS